MELTKKAGETATFVWNGVNFHVRAKGTAGDRFELNMLFDVDIQGKVKVPRRELYRTLISRFVTGWDGVEEDGKAVPFSLENLDRLPVDGNEDVILLLGSFIFNKSGLFPTAEEAARKNA